MNKKILIGITFIGGILLSGCSGIQPTCKKCSVGTYNEMTKTCVLNEHISGVVKQIISNKEKTGNIDLDKNGNKVDNYILVSTDSGRRIVIPNYNKNKVGDIINVFFEKKPQCD